MKGHMGRISEDNPKCRTKDDIANDVAFILKADITYGTKYGVINEVCWVWTGFTGKYKGCPYWSKMAVMQHRLNPKAKLKHEHVVPRKVVADMLFSLDQATSGRVREILDTFLLGVVVTPEEDAVLSIDYRAQMPEEFYNRAHPSYHEPWLRYMRCGIEIIRQLPTSDS